MAEQPDERHQRPEGVDDATVEAVGRASESFEWVVRARGRLYDFHQMMGRADILLGEAISLLEDAGHAELAGELRRDYLGRNAVEGRWTFELVEDFDGTFYERAARWDRRLRDELTGGVRHLHESEMKAARRQGGPHDDA
ncbi:MAG: hypothetical protein KY457_01990 [Actinobacteria bacterium]|nr:hypothetical protein [Actinomycetota bacterium]